MKPKLGWALELCDYPCLGYAGARPGATALHFDRIELDIQSEAAFGALGFVHGLRSRI